MATVNCTVVGGGGWNAVAQTFPANQNDGLDTTYQAWPGDQAGTQNNSYDSSVIPADAVISAVAVSGSWANGGGVASVTVRCYLGANNTLLDSNLAAVSSYSYGIARPGGGTWTKTDIANMYVSFISNQNGGGNNMRLRSSVLTVTYVLSGMTYIAIF